MMKLRNSLVNYGHRLTPLSYSAVKCTKYDAMAVHFKNFYHLQQHDETTIGRRKISSSLWIGTTKGETCHRAKWRRRVQKWQNAHAKYFGRDNFSASEYFFRTCFQQHISHGNNPWERNRYARHVPCAVRLREVNKRRKLTWGFLQ